MSRPRALVLAAPGTNRHHDVVVRPRPRRRRGRPRCCSPRRSPSPQRLADARDPRRRRRVQLRRRARRRADVGARAAPPPGRRARRVRRRRQAGDRDLQRLPGAHRRRACCPVRSDTTPTAGSTADGWRSTPSRRRRCIWTAGPRPHRVPDRPRRGPLRAPRPRRAGRRRPGGAALRRQQPERLGRRHRRRLRPDRPRARADAAPGEPRDRPPAPRASAAASRRPAADHRACRCSSRACATPRSAEMPADRPAPRAVHGRRPRTRPTGATARCACPTPGATTGCSSPPIACRRSTG